MRRLRAILEREAGESVADAGGGQRVTVAAG